MLDNLNQASNAFKMKLDNHVFDSVKDAVSKFTEQERLFERCEENLADKSKEVEEKEIKIEKSSIYNDSKLNREQEILKKLNRKDQVFLIISKC